MHPSLKMYRMMTFKQCICIQILLLEIREDDLMSNAFGILKTNKHTSGQKKASINSIN